MISESQTLRHQRQPRSRGRLGPQPDRSALMEPRLKPQALPSTPGLAMGNTSANRVKNVHLDAKEPAGNWENGSVGTDALKPAGIDI